MDTRKIQTVGGGTYTVSLPKEWAREQGVETGQVVELHSHLDGVLCLQLREGAGDDGGPVTVHLDGDDPIDVERTLRAAYAAGAKTITLESAAGFDRAERRSVERVCRGLTGMTVAEASERSLTVRTPLRPEEVSVYQSVRQLRFVSLSMHRDAFAALRGELTPEGVFDRDDQADRLHALVDRHFVRSLSRLDEIDALGLSRPALFDLWVTSRELERVADHAESIARVVDQADGTLAGPLDDVDALAGTARGVVEDAVTVVVGDADVRTAREALRTRDELREEVEATDRDLFAADAADYRLTGVLDSVRRTAEHGGTIAELGIRRAIREDALPTAAAFGSPADADRSASAESDR